mgnify:CR=1 FL=1
MSLQFIFGNSGSGKSHCLYQNIVEESIRHPEELSCPCAGTVYDADAERPVPDASQRRDHEHRCPQLRTPCPQSV